MKQIVHGLLFGVMLMGSQAFADFGEIDLIVRESVESVFLELGRSVDMSTLEYFGNSNIEDSIMTIESSVWAWQGFTNELGIHDCVTKIEILEPGVYRDLGSECLYDHDW